MLFLFIFIFLNLEHQHLISRISLPISLNFPFTGVLSFFDLEILFLCESGLSLNPDDPSPQLI